MESNQDTPKTTIRLGYSGIPLKGQAAGRNLDQIELLAQAGVAPDRIYQDNRSKKGFQAFIDEGLRLAELGFRVELYTIHVSHWERQAKDLISLVKELEAHGVYCYALDYGVLSAENKEEESKRSGLAKGGQSIREQASARATSSLQARIDAGIPIGGKPPFGYKWNAGNTGYEPDLETWEIARFAVDVFLDSKCSTYAVSRAVSKHYGRKWDSSSINRWLRNETLMGCIPYRKVGIILPDRHKALITKQEFKQIQKQLERNRTRAVKKGNTKSSRQYAISSGNCRCAWCGSRLASSTSRGHRYFRCRQCDDWKGSARADKVEEAILQELSTRVKTLDEIDLRDKRIDKAKLLINPDTWGNMDEAERRALYRDVLDYVVCRGGEFEDIVLKI